MTSKSNGNMPQRFYRKILVVTDSFPPDVAGGAELSLYSAMRKMDSHDTTTVVIALSKNVEKPTVARVDGFKVYRIPFHSEWPEFTREPSRWARYKKFVAELVRCRSDVFRYVKAVLVNVWMHKRHPNSLGIFPLMDRFYLLHARATDYMKEIVELEQPDLVHADNYRSIVMAAMFHDKYPSVSLVRDNRFYCTHRNQATNIRGEVCTTCSFGCTSSKASPLVERSVRNLMKDTLNIRHNALNSSGAVAVTSDFLYRQVSQIVPADKIVTIPNVTESPDLVDEWIGTPSLPDEPKIFCVGMIGHNKGQLSLLKAFKVVVEKFPDAKLILAGRGGMVKRIKEQAKAWGIENQVQFLGFLDRKSIYKHYAECTLVVCPNIWPEPFGRVPLEAGLASKPVVAYNTGALSETVIPGETGLLVQPQDDTALASAIIELLSNPELIEQMGRKGREHIAARHYSIDPARSLMNAWESVLQS